ncbi:MAG: acylneuraminate cytidylyltransferase family protein [Methylococcaceae bacterium]|nr:acylneuraminate cytidylyltransferase family protein [Methylococcaceae bacterium]
MYQGKRILAVIPARGGSKGLPGKNIRPLAGKPLLAWSIEAARRSRYIDRIVLSSDDPAIMETARQWGAEVPFRRPPELATDQALGIDVVLHAIEQVPGFDYVVLCQPTSPLRLAEDIDGAIEKLFETAAPVCVSVTETEKTPYWMFTLAQGDRMVPVMEHPNRSVNRQELPKVYVLNGAVYVAEIGWFQRVRSFLTDQTLGYVMPANRSVDIDSERDFLLAEILLSGRI